MFNGLPSVRINPAESGARGCSFTASAAEVIGKWSGWRWPNRPDVEAGPRIIRFASLEGVSRLHGSLVIRAPPDFAAEDRCRRPERRKLLRLIDQQRPLCVRERSGVIVVESFGGSRRGGEIS